MSTRCSAHAAVGIVAAGASTGPVAARSIASRPPFDVRSFGATADADERPRAEQSLDEFDRGRGGRDKPDLGVAQNSGVPGTKALTAAQNCVR